MMNKLKMYVVLMYLIKENLAPHLSYIQKMALTMLLLRTNLS